MRSLLATQRAGCQHSWEPQPPRVCVATGSFLHSQCGHQRVLWPMPGGAGVSSKYNIPSWGFPANRRWCLPSDLTHSRCFNAHRTVAGR